MANPSAADELDRVVEPIRSLMREASPRWSINALSSATLIPFTSLRRRLYEGDSLTLGDLRRIAEALGASPAAVIPRPFTAAIEAA